MDRSTMPARWLAAGLASVAVTLAGPGVVPAVGAAAASAAEPVKILVEIPKMATQGEPFAVTATLVDRDRRPVAVATIEFARQTLYGWLSLGNAETDARGVARLEVTEHAIERLLLRATFAGSVRLAAGEAMASIWVQESVSRSMMTTRTFLPIGTIGIEARAGMPAVAAMSRLPLVTLALLVGGVWATYAYVLALMAGVWVDGRRRRGRGRWDLRHNRQVL